MKTRVLIVEDEQGIRELTSLFLEEKGFRVLQAQDGIEALEIVNAKSPDVILLDIQMPGMDGFKVCKLIREQTKAPVLFISCKKDLVDKLTGLRSGGDDYITKPFDFFELEARILAVLRRDRWIKIAEEDPAMITHGPMQIHLSSCELYIGEKQIPLLPKEFQLLVLLAEHPNQVFDPEQIYNHIWGYESEGTSQTVKVHISNLRRKLEEDPTNPTYIYTVRGFGYKFVNQNRVASTVDLSMGING